MVSTIPGSSLPFKRKKHLSQVFLRDYSSVSETFENLDLEGKTIIEIGAGTGVITEVLARKAKKVIALEVDPGLCSVLKQKTSALKNVEVMCADAMQASLNYPVVIGFIPYHISSPLLFRLLKSNFGEALLCVQKEFAARLVAPAGSPDFSKLSVMARSQADIEYIATVPRSAFSPIPKVDSALVYFVKKANFGLNETLVSALFQHKNQTIRNSLLHSERIIGLKKENIREFCSSFNSSRKARTLQLKEIEALSRKYEAFFRQHK